jgi:hypothetical protein
MRYKQFLYATIGVIFLSSVACAEDSASNFSLHAAQGENKDTSFHRQQFFPLKPGNINMSSRPLVRMSPPAAQPISMSKSPQAAVVSAKAIEAAPKVLAEAGFQPVLKAKTGASTMSREQAQQIISLFSSAE